MGRAPCCDKATVKKGPWSPEEDVELKAYIEQHGTGGNWIVLPQKIGLNRCGKSCRLRWLNYLRPNIKHGGFSEQEDNIICSLYVSIGSRWSIIAAQLPGRTDNDIKNYWNTKLKKKLLGKQRKNQRARPARCVKQEMKRESGNLFTTEAIDTYPSLQEAVPLPTVDSNEENNFKDQTSIDSFILKLGGTFQTINYDQQLSNSRNNHYLRCPSEISCSQDQFFGNSMAMYASSVSMNITNGTCSPSTSGCYPINWVGANNFQGYNNVPAQLDEIPYSDSQHFDGLESFSGMDMVKSSTVTTSTSPESVSWADISSLVYPPMASNLELCQGLVPQNCTIGSSGYMGLRQPYFASMV